MIYLDHAATTPLRDEARAVLAEFIAADGPFANPSSQYQAGRQMAARIAQAREEFAALIGAEASDIIWTSGATEANNLAILGRARFAKGLGRKLLVPRTEHKAVIDPVRHLVGQGWKATWLDPGADGICAPEQFASGLDGDTVLACAMWVNNETGLVHDVETLAPLAAAQGVPLHVDAAQALGKVPVEAFSGVGSMSFSGHKLGAPPGVGALYLRSRPRVGIQPLQFGGGQERGLRSGTLASAQILAFVAAAVAACRERVREQQRLSVLREQLWEMLSTGLSGLIRNGSAHTGSAHVLNVTFPGVHGESLRAALPQLAVSSGSACSSAQAESSYVLRALGHDDDQANASLRFSFGHTTTADEIARAGHDVVATVRRLRSWEP